MGEDVSSDLGRILFVDDDRDVLTSARVLKDGDRIQFGTSVFLFDQHEVTLRDQRPLHRVLSPEPVRAEKDYSSLSFSTATMIVPRRVVAGTSWRFGSYFATVSPPVHTLG